MTSQPAQQSTFIPDKTTTYLTKPYWDERFASEESYEWCKSFEDFGHLLRPHFTPYDSILEIGAGNSSLSSQLAAELSNSYVCSLDISQVVAEKMQEQQLEQGASIQWQVGDMLCLPFCDASLDVVIEKGALDVFLVDRQSPWDPALVAAARMRTALLEIHRVLRAGGRFLSITFDQPHFRKPFLEASGLTWDIRLETFGDGLQYFVYVLCKGARVPRSLGTASLEAGPRQVLAESAQHEHMDQEDYLLAMDL